MAGILRLALARAFLMIAPLGPAPAPAAISGAGELPVTVHDVVGPMTVASWKEAAPRSWGQTYRIFKVRLFTHIWKKQKDTTSAF